MWLCIEDVLCRRFDPGTKAVPFDKFIHVEPQTSKTTYLYINLESVDRVWSIAEYKFINYLNEHESEAIQGKITISMFKTLYTYLSADLLDKAIPPYTTLERIKKHK